MPTLFSAAFAPMASANSRIDISDLISHEGVNAFAINSARERDQILSWPSVCIAEEALVRSAAAQQKLTEAARESLSSARLQLLRKLEKPVLFRIRLANTQRRSRCI